VRKREIVPDILHRVGIKSSDAKVFWALSDEQELAGWWTRNVKASPGVGAGIPFRCDDKGFNDMKVLELSPGRCVRWQCVDGAKEWIGTELSFELKEKDGVTVLLFAQRLEGTGRVHARRFH
jgi:uncharacterized protein YndB with AHSA1/START domain